MLSLFSSLWAKIAGIGAVVVAAIGGLLALYFNIRSSGEAVVANADLKEGIKDVQTSETVETTVANESDAAVHDQLYATYSRDSAAVSDVPKNTN